VASSLEQWRRDHYRDDAGAPPAPPTRTDTEVSVEIARYRETAEQLHTHIELAGFKTRLRVPIELQELYVALHANGDLRAVGDAEFADASDAETVLREHGGARDVALVEAFREAFQRNRRGLVILGDPGSGKTTHLKRVLLWCLREGPQTLGLAADILPVFLPLRALKDVSQGLEAFIESQLDDPHLRMSEGFGARLLQRGRLLLLFDGLDEVADRDERAEVSRWVESVVRAHSTCVPVVTCRFAGYGGGARLGPEFLELHLRPLTREQSEAFIRNWYRIVETGLAPDPAQGERLVLSTA
jgi:predicted NACHT family NTPase